MTLDVSLIIVGVVPLACDLLSDFLNCASPLPPYLSVSSTVVFFLSHKYAKRRAQRRRVCWPPAQTLIEWGE